MKNIKYIILSSVIVLATGLVSCLDSEFDVDESYNRLFSPVSFETTNETSTTVDFTWKNIPGSQLLSYRAESYGRFLPKFIKHTERIRK